MNYTWSSPDSVRILNIGREERDHTILGIKSTLNIGANALLSFVHAQASVSETGEFNITGQGTGIAIYKSSLCLFNYGSLVCQSQELKGQSAEIALSNDSKMDLSTVDMFSDEGDFNVTVNDNAHLTIKANQIVTLNGCNMIFNLSGESSCMGFSPANTHAPFDFTRERYAENGNLLAFNFITADDESQNPEIIFDFNGFSLHARQQQAKKLLANGYLSLNGKVNTDEDTFFIYVSAFNSQIVVSLSGLQL